MTSRVPPLKVVISATLADIASGCSEPAADPTGPFAPAVAWPTGLPARALAVLDAPSGMIALAFQLRDAVGVLDAGRGDLNPAAAEVGGSPLAIAALDATYRRSLGQPPHHPAYGACRHCEPVLVRTDSGGLLGDFVQEHDVFVDFDLILERGDGIRAVRTSGNRSELQDELRRRGVYVLRDDEPLAIAHREVKAARERGERKGRRSRA